ncbi:MAG: hypothetical protein Q8O67_33990 [Deltaproteobacteria bacterium]|nr:hypothetical protein [Deltaproteobacteria bacterium]
MLRNASERWPARRLVQSENVRPLARNEPPRDHVAIEAKHDPHGQLHVQVPSELNAHLPSGVDAQYQLPLLPNLQL